MTENNEIMKFEEVMKYLNISKITLYNLLRNGEIKSFRIGKVWKIPSSAVEEYIRKCMNLLELNSKVAKVGEFFLYSSNRVNLQD